MIDGLPLKLLKVLSAESLFPELDSTRQFLLDQILNSEVVDIFPDDNAQLKLDSKTVVAKFSQPLPPHKFSVGQSVSGEVMRVFPDGRAQIMLAGHTFTAELNKPLPVGRNVTAKIEQLSPFPIISLQSLPEHTKADRATLSQHSLAVPVDSTDARKDFFAGAVLGKADLESLKLSLGQVIEGKVAANLGNEKFLIEINGKQLEVISPFGLSPGDSVLARVDRVDGEYRLVFIPQNMEGQPAIDPMLIKSYLSAKKPFGEMLENLVKMMDGNPLPADLDIDPKLIDNLKDTLKSLVSDNPTPDANRIKNQIIQSGVNYEAKLRKVLMENPESEIISDRIELDLKGQLLKLANELESIPKGSAATTLRQNPKVAEVLQGLRQAIDNIELNQLSNHFAKQDGQPVLVQIPYPAVDEKSINLYVKKQPGGDKKKPDDKQGFNLVFLLEMTSLGNLRVDAQVNNDQLHVKIGAESQEVVDFIQTNAVDLKKRLQEIGFCPEVNCGRQKKDEMRVEESLTRLFVQDPSRLIDLKT